jgi:hypothetical protein
MNSLILCVHKDSNLGPADSEFLSEPFRNHLAGRQITRFTRLSQREYYDFPRRTRTTSPAFLRAARLRIMARFRLCRRIHVNPQGGFPVEAALSLTRQRRLASAVSMIAELTDLDRTVIEALSARYARGGEAAFDEAVSRLVVALCALLAHTRGMARLRDLIGLVEAVSAASGKRGGLH